jgi:hypothetical protein
MPNAINIKMDPMVDVAANLAGAMSMVGRKISDYH